MNVAELENRNLSYLSALLIFTLFGCDAAVEDPPDNSPIPLQGVHSQGEVAPGSAMARDLRTFVEQSDDYSAEDVQWNNLKTASLKIKGKPESEQIVIAPLKASGKMRFSVSGEERSISITQSQIIFIPSLDRAIKEEVAMKDKQVTHVRLSRMGGAYGAIYRVSENVPKRRVAIFGNAPTVASSSSESGEGISASYAYAQACSTAFCDGTWNCISAAHQVCATDGVCLVLLIALDAKYLSGTALIATACFIHNNF